MLTEKKINMKCKVVFSLAAAFCAMALNLGCSINPLADSEAGNPTVISTAALINMPSSLANPIAGQEHSSRPYSEDEAENIYSFILLQNYFVNELVNGEILSVRWLIEEYIAKLPWGIIKKMPGGYITDSALYHFEAVYNENGELPYYAMIEYTLPGS